MAKRAEPDPLVGPLPDLMRWWQLQNVRGVVIGGFAVAILGRPRVTRDIDALVLLPEERWAAFLESGRAFGFSPRQSEALEFARRSRVLLVHHRRSAIDIDISLGCLPFEEETVARAKRKRIAGVSVPLASPEDLIVMKAVAHRDRDRLDIEGLLAVQPRLDLKRIRRWVGEFAAILEMPELSDDLEYLIAKQVKPKRRSRKRKS